MPENIHPVFKEIVQRSSKMDLLKQHSKAIWLTGLSGSGKSTIAIALEKRLYDEGYLTQILDGDNIRSGLNNNLGFSPEDRKENIRRIAETTKLFVNCGIISINCFVSPSEEIRQTARVIIGEKDFIEVFIDTPLEVCEERDVKGLYKKARKGEIKNFTGIGAPFEAPKRPNLTISTEGKAIEQSVVELYEFIIKKIKI